MTAKLTTGVLGATGYSGMELLRILAHHPKIEAPRLFRRQVGVEALIRYGRWLKIATPEAEFKPDLLRPIFDLLEQKLDPKLDPKQDPSVAVREMFGMQFRLLAWLDLDWFASVIPKLFPRKAEKILDRFAWNAYLQFGGPLLATFPAMRKRYEAAVLALQKGEQKVPELDCILANHLMQYYAHGVLELDDKLLVQFFERASGPPPSTSRGVAVRQRAQ